MAKVKQSSFSKKLIEQTENSARIIDVFEKHGFEVQSMEHFQAIVADLFQVLGGKRAGGKKRGRKPGSRGPGRPPLSAKGPGRPAKKRRGRPKGTGAKRGRKPKQVVEASAE